MILTKRKPTLHNAQEPLFSYDELAKVKGPKQTTYGKENEEVLCYFRYNNRGPVGHAELSVEFTYFWTWHFTEELKRYILPKGQFVYDDTDQKFWLHPDATHLVHDECLQQRYTCIGYRPKEDVESNS